MKVSVFNPKKNGVPGLPSIFDEFFSDSFFKPEIQATEAKMNPSVNVISNENGYEVELLAPGMKKEDFSLEVEKDQLIVKGASESEKETDEKNYTRKEFWKGSFEKVFNLPEDIDADAIKAKYENGILFIEIPKAEEKENKTKVVKVA